MSSLSPISPVASSAPVIKLYRAALPVNTPQGKIDYLALQDALDAGDLVAARRAYAALQLDATAHQPAADPPTASPAA